MLFSLLGAWLAWRIYKQRLPGILQEGDFLFPAPFAVAAEDTPLLQQQQQQQQQVLLQQQLQQQHDLIIGPECNFIPFRGEGRRLGSQQDLNSHDKP